MEIANAYADIHAEKDRKRYADHHNMRNTDRKYQVAGKVVPLEPVTNGSRTKYATSNDEEGWLKADGLLQQFPRLYPFIGRNSSHYN